MSTPNYPDYGHANCPNCGADVDLNNSLWGLNAPPTRGSYEKFYLFLCNTCGEKYFSLNDSEQEVEAKEIIRKAMDALQLGNPNSIAVATLTALIANEWNISDAIEYGVPISRELHDRIYAGKINPHDIAPLLREIALNRDS
jgi:hypothetical protein